MYQFPWKISQDSTEYKPTSWNIIIYASKFKKNLEWKETPVSYEDLPRNSLLNISPKGFVKLYTKIKDFHDHVLDNIVTKWKERFDMEIGTISVG